MRWGDERTYTSVLFEMPPSFAGIPKDDIISIGSYGCCQSKEDKYYLIHGLESMRDSDQSQREMIGSDRRLSLKERQSLFLSERKR